MDIKNLKNYVIYGTGIIAFCLILLSIIFSSYNKLSGLEVALFNVLQFTFSIIFTWLFSTATSEKQFKESQRKFAISAYRRILEIDKGIERIITLTEGNNEKTNTIVIQTAAIGIQESIKSSIADWTDIIGPEIETIEEIKYFKAQYPKTEDVSLDNSNGKDNIVLNNTDNVIKELQDKLPPSLRNIYDSNTRPVIYSLMESELASKGFNEFHVGHRSKVDVDYDKYSLGTILTVRVNNGTLRVYDSSDIYIGNILNVYYRIKSGGVSYSTFSNVVTSYYGNEFYVEVSGREKARLLVKTLPNQIKGEVTA